jgi:hypothetical protein
MAGTGPTMRTTNLPVLLDSLSIKNYIIEHERF